MILWVVTAIVAFALYAMKDILRSILRPWTSPSPLLNLKGPNNGTLFMGHAMGYKRNSVQPERWIQKVFEKFGHVTVLRGQFNSRILSTTDLKAIAHVYNNPYIYQKMPQLSFEFENFVGDGIFVTEGDKHRRHRRIINPAFGQSYIRNMCQMFLSGSDSLKEQLQNLCELQKGQDGWAETDILSWFSRASLDLVGMAGFDYSINSLANRDNELFAALNDVFSDCKINPRLFILKFWVPLLRLWTLDSTSRRLKRLRTMMRNIGKEVMARKRRAIQEGLSDADSRDVLTLLIRANQGESNPTKKMTEEEVLGQVPSFLVAAHEGVAGAMAWTLCSLCNHPDIQTRLRAELESLHDEPTADELDSLTYLDQVLRESLRYHSVFAVYEQAAIRDDVIPCETPYEDRHGNIRHDIIISKGDAVRIPIFVINRLESIWGPDAHEFNPDRWQNPPKATERIPGVWGNQATFLAGPRSCPGFRFSILEMKALLFVLIRTYEFELAVPKETVFRRPLAAVLPIIKGQSTCGLPMRIRRVT